MYIKIYYKKYEGEEYINEIRLQDWMNMLYIIEGTFKFDDGKISFKFNQVHSSGEFVGIINDKRGMEKSKDGDMRTEEYKLKSFEIKGSDF